MLGFTSPDNYRRAERKYVWIQVGMSFFNDTTIRRLERKPCGTTAIFAYIKLLTQACKFNGELRNDDGEPIERADFCLWFTTPDPDQLEDAFDLLIETNLVTFIPEKGVYHLRDAETLTGSRTSAADRMSKMRGEKQESRTQDEPKGTVDQDSPKTPSKPKEKPKKTTPENNESCLDDVKKNKVVSIKTGETIEIERDPVVEVVEYLNRTTGNRYKPTTKNTQKLIKARINDGYSIDDLKHIVDIKAAEWMNDPKMRVYLAPDTLFSESKAEKYLNQWQTSAAYIFHNGESTTPDEGMAVLMEDKA